MFSTRLSEVRDIVDNWVIEYNEQRLHESLGNLTPEEFTITHIENSSLALHLVGFIYIYTQLKRPKQRPLSDRGLCRGIARGA